MANDVFANGREISCKKADGKSICAFPDVCFTPPENPATPPGVPIPYPNTGLASDTTEGSKSVQISKKEIMLKNKSYFKKSIGDEAGCAAKKGFVTSVHRGKVYFIAWSIDVKAEGENVVRHLDMTTHNHASPTANTPPTIHVDGMAFEFPESCRNHVDQNNDACQGATQLHGPDGEKAGMNCDTAKNPEACKEARQCLLMPKDKDKSFCCDPNTTGDHIIEVNCFTEIGGRTPNKYYKSADVEAIGGVAITYAEGMTKTTPRRLPPFEKYDEEEAPTACVEPPGAGTNHNRMQAHRDQLKRQLRNSGLENGMDPKEFGLARREESWWTYDQCADVAVASHQREFPHCNPECTRAQLDAYHHQILPGDSPEEKNNTRVRTHIPGRSPWREELE